jgi:NRE family putative nickel resistance protein-like MFS transporter
MANSQTSTIEPIDTSRLRAFARRRYGGALSNGSFRWLWLLSLFSAGSDAIATVAMPLLVYDLTDSAGLLGIMFMLQQIPRVVLSPVAGVIADRVDRRVILFWSAIIRAVFAAAIPFTDHVWQIAVLAMFSAATSTLARPCELAALPALLSGSEFIQGLSLIQVTNNVMRMVGPAAGAALISFTSPSRAFWLQALCVLASAGAAWRLTLPPHAASEELSGWRASVQRGWGDLGEGLRTVWRTPVVRGIIAAESLWSFVSAAMIVAGVVLTEDALDLGGRAEGIYGALTATFSGGAVCGALLAGRLERSVGRNAMLALGYLGPLLLVPVWATPPLPVLFVFWFAFGLADALAVVALQSYMAESVPDALRGRVYATWIACVTGVSLGSYSLAGWLTDRFGAPETFAIVGIVTGIGGPLLLWVSGALASIRSHTRPTMH